MTNFLSRAELRESASVYSIWTIVDSHFRCINRPELKDSVLSDYLLSHGFDIPSEITYCLATNYTTGFELKFRVFGAKIHVYIKPLKKLL